MEKLFITPAGREVREVTAQELDRFATIGDGDAKRAVLKKQLEGAKSDTEKLNLVIAFLTEGV